MNGEVSVINKPWCKELESRLPAVEIQLVLNMGSVLLRHTDGRVWLAVEDSIYEPMDFKNVDANNIPDDSADWPFETYGEQWFVNLGENTYLARDFHAVEGEIQGITYAIYGVKGDVILEPRHYEKYLQELLENVLSDNYDKPARPLDSKTLDRLAELVLQ